MTVRTASPEDASEILDIYAPYVENTAITFEYDVPDLNEFRQRIVNTLKKYPYIVAVEDGKIVGYAYAGTFKARAAYDRSVETSIYIKTDERGKGIGKTLYNELESRLKEQGILNLNACISWIDTPDEYLTHQSPEFHARLGYTRCAHFHKCGYKFGKWFDMIWMEKMIGEHV
ncbi:MAG: N-acetyltransferase [Bacteroidaceae bacterium]|nr:N-acetyltransferase [Bacteroidaceae bacterium]